MDRLSLVGAGLVVGEFDCVGVLVGLADGDFEGISEGEDEGDDDG